MQNPLISIVLPTYNGAKYLDESIQSCLSQTYGNWELIIIDDCSTDGVTPALVDAWAKRDSRIHTFHNSVNRRLPASLNIGFSQARGEFFTWTSDDNRFAPDALAVMIKALLGRPSTDLVYAGYDLIDGTGKKTGQVSTRPLEDLWMTSVVGACFLYRSHVHTALGGYDENLFLAEDYDFWLRASCRFKMEPLSEILYEYRYHEGALTSTHSEKTSVPADQALARSLPCMTWMSVENRIEAYLRLLKGALVRREFEKAFSFMKDAARISPPLFLWVGLKKPLRVLKKFWVKKTILNVAEHSITRGADALSSLILIAALPSETFSQLVVAQAWVAPLLLLFLSPEVVIYRDYAKWKAEGDSALLARIRVFRNFALGKWAFAILISLLVTSVIPGRAAPFWAFVWAFTLALTPQVLGPDRELLRLELKLKKLNVLNLFQKITLLLATIIASKAASGDLRLLALLTAASTALTWIFLVATQPRVEKTKVSALSVLRDSVASYTLFSHVNGVIFNGVQTLDLLFLNYFKFPPSVLGLYGAALKLANFTQAIPMALSHTVQLWMGRQTENMTELQKVKKLSFGFFIGTGFQNLFLVFLSPWLISLLSHGRWTLEQQMMVRTWLTALLFGTWIFSSTFLWSGWLAIRTSTKQMLFQIYLPLLAASGVIYGLAAREFGPNGVAWANVVVYLIYAVFLLIFSIFSKTRTIRADVFPSP